VWLCFRAATRYWAASQHHESNVFALCFVCQDRFDNRFKISGFLSQRLKASTFACVEARLEPTHVAQHGGALNIMHAGLLSASLGFESDEDISFYPDCERLLE
jgi:hypothetical protein